MSDVTLESVLTRRHPSGQAIVNVDEPPVKLVVFTLGDAWFAFYGECIREILAQTDVFFVPGCPPSLEGVINVRGDIESVIRFNEMLQLPATSTASGSSILLGRAGGISSGVRVDRVIDVVDVTPSSIQAPPATLPAHMSALVLGVLHFQAQPVALLNLDAMFTHYARGLG